MIDKDIPADGVPSSLKNIPEKNVHIVHLVTNSIPWPTRPSRMVQKRPSAFQAGSRELVKRIWNNAACPAAIAT